uniref:Putative secreted protein n=1 Tax=Anopheles marajoara TaxID=58244 RepID=A0A2M4CEW0_9DIPT
MRLVGWLVRFALFLLRNTSPPGCGGAICAALIMEKYVHVVCFHRAWYLPQAKDTKRDIFFCFFPMIWI